MARKTIPEKVETAKEEIISAALDLIISDGFSKFTLSNVANKVGITKAAIYWYFKSKEEILNIMAASLKATLFDSAKQLANQPISPRQKLEALILSLEDSEVHKKCFLLLKVFLELYSVDDEIKTLIRDGYREYIEIVEGIIYEIQKTGELNTTISSKTLAKFFVAALDGCIIQDEISEYRMDYREIKDFLVSVF